MITDQYVLFTRIPIVETSSGRIFTDHLWAKDLILHCRYIENLGICCPCIQSDQTKDLVDITDIGLNYFQKLYQDHGLLSVIKNFFPNWLSVFRACRKGKVVHSGGAGWAFPLSFYIWLIKPFCSFRWIVVIESSFWMLAENDKKTVRNLINHYVHRFVLARCVKAADARVFTQSFYRRYFLGDDTTRTLINPATWVDDQALVSESEVKERFVARQGEALKLIFPARLVDEKGVDVVLEAIDKISDTSVAIELLILGAGPLAEKCAAFAARDFGSRVVRYRTPVEYGAEFLRVVSEHDYVIVANLKQEQPRIVFDAFSQGVAVIASNTSGIRDITCKENAILFETGDATSLAEAILFAASDRYRAVRLGLHGLEYARGKTHERMHLDRQLFLEGILGSR